MEAMEAIGRAAESTTCHGPMLRPTTPEMREMECITPGECQGPIGRGMVAFRPGISIGAAAAARERTDCEV